MKATLILLALGLGLVLGQNLRELLGEEEYAALSCQRNRSTLRSALHERWQLPCRKCLGVGSNVFLMRSLVRKDWECRNSSDFPARTLGKYYALHYVCTYSMCGMPYVPIRYREDDVHCNYNGNFSIITIYVPTF